MSDRQRFMISTNSVAGDPVGATVSERDAITEYFKGRGWQFWHWFQDLWLVVVPSGAQPVALDLLREDLRRLMAPGGRHILIVSVEDGAHAGMAPADAWRWMRNVWAEPTHAAGEMASVTRS